MVLPLNLEQFAMSDFDRTKDQKHKKFYGYKDRREHGTWGARRMPIILAKPSRERERETDIDKERSIDNRSPAKPLSQPTIILKNRETENRPASQQSAQRPPAVMRKESDAQPLYQLAGKHATGENANPLALPPEMQNVVKLMDENSQMNDAILEYLLEQPDFTVVGVLGLQGVGKSTVASLIAGDDYKTSIRKPLFKPQGQEQHETGTHCTHGIDVIITTNRMIVLDTQPILSASVMDKHVLQEGKKFGPGPVGPPGPAGTTADYASTENMVEIQSLQQAAFLLSVCHIVILVQDWFFDPNIIRFIQTAEMLKPSTPTTSVDDEIIEYFPHVVFLQNRATPSHFGPNAVKVMQDMYNKLFLRSRLQIQTGLGITRGNVIENLKPEHCGEPINLFLLPDMTSEILAAGNGEEAEDDMYFTGHPGLNELVKALRYQLLGSIVQPLSHTSLTEKNWFHYASKIWELVKKSSFFLEYSRLLP